MLPEVSAIALHERDADVAAATEKVVSSLFAEAKALADQQPEAFQNWSDPARLILERLREWAHGQNPDGLFGVRYQAWRPTFTQEEASNYLEVLRGLLV